MVANTIITQAKNCHRTAKHNDQRNNYVGGSNIEKKQNTGNKNRSRTANNCGILPRRRLFFNQYFLIH